MIGSSLRQLLIFLASAFVARGVNFQTHRIDPGKELLITDPAVVESNHTVYPGVWSWGHVMEQALGAEKAPAGVAKWLEDWAGGRFKDSAGQPIPGLGTREGVREKIMLTWQKRDGFSPASREPWKPNLANAPFRLLAIVNRMDLGGPPPASSGSAYQASSGLVEHTAGEARLVFCLVDENDHPAEPGLTLIAEYGLDGLQEARRLDWAMAWHAFGTHQAFDAAYCEDLASLTRCFIDRRPDSIPAAAQPAGVLDHLRQDAEAKSMQLMRLRLNDGVTGKVREFREFTVQAGQLSPGKLPGSPAPEFFDPKQPANRELTRWLEVEAVRFRRDQEEAIRQKPETRRLPLSVSLPEALTISRKQQVVSTFALPARQPDDHWDGWAMRDPELRRTVSLNSCCGCHCGDTNSAFFHIFPRENGKASELSKFLRVDGTSWRIKDPQSNERLDSHEMEDRAELLSDILNPGMSLSDKLNIRKSRALRVH